MKILLAATELAPFARVGDLADVISSLAKALHQQGHEVRIVCPAFEKFWRAGVQAARRLTPLKFEMNGREFEATLFDTKISSGVELTLIDVEGMFERPGIYGEGEQDYDDNAWRFAVFSRAVVAWMAQLTEQDRGFDVVHAHDWPTALVPVYAKLEPFASILEQTKTVFTVHNVAYQGLVSGERRAEFGIPEEVFHPDALEFYGKLNLLKGGIIFADVVTTVSEGYAREITHQEGGFGLEGVLAANVSKLIGIQNGIDYSRCNPAIDPALVSRFDAQDPSRRTQCKTQLLQEVGLAVDPRRPLIGFVGFLSQQKGAEELLAAVEPILESDVSLVVAVEREGEFGGRFKELANAHADRLAYVVEPRKELAHRVLAGADMIIVPSRNEPCGCMAKCAQRYGSVPIVAAVGGLIDAVVDADAKLETGSGFVYAKDSVDGLVAAVLRALAAYATPAWADFQRRIMNLDLGWDRPVRRYEQIYRRLISAGK